MRAILLLTLLGAVVADQYNVYWYDRANTLPDRQLMVHLFEWKWTDIASECESFLQHYGYGAVQVSPPMEHLDAVQNNNKPWWIRYQPVSYELSSRSGTEAQFQDMVNRCNKVGVRIIVDVVSNHMVGVGQKKGVSGIGSSGASNFDGTDGVETFSGVPYSSNDFNDFRCHGDIQGSDYQNNAEHVKDCRLVGLLDLNQGSSYVRGKIVAYLNKLISYGVAGFRFDASKHMWPADLGAILNATNNVKSDIFGANQRAFTVHEVIDRGGEAVKCTDYVTIGRYTNFNFGAAVSAAAKGQADWRGLAKLGPGYGYGNAEDHDVLNFIDNHDNQRDSQPYVVTYKDGDHYKMAVAFMLAWAYGYPRVMSSYYFSYSDQGPPSTGNPSYTTTSPTFNPDSTCNSNSGWVCEHRWPSIREMAKFHQAVSGTAVSDIFTDYNRLAFARSGKGFFVVNQQGAFTKVYQTTLPAGTYCDHYSGGLSNGKCAGSTVVVRDDGTASINVPGMSVVAISLASRTTPAPAPTPIPSSWQKTVVFLRVQTNPGQNLFVRGGTSHAHTCSSSQHNQPNDPCAIPIAHNTTVPFVYSEYLTWSQQDNYLDFEGDELLQGTHDGDVASGTPLAYSTNDPSAVEYQPLNKYGPAYWMVQMFMDCSKAENGWFELKGYVSPDVGWENNISQQQCGGSVGGKAPFSSINHVAKCGAINVFVWNTGTCTINSF